MQSSQVPQIFAKKARAARYRRARTRSSNQGAADYLILDMIEEVLERVDFMRLAEGDAVVVGDFSATLASALKGRGIAAQTHDPASYNEEQPWDGPSPDFLFSLGTLDTLNDLPGALLHYRNALREGGLFIGQMIGAGSLPSMRQIMLEADGDRPAARLHPQVDNRAATALLERAGFARQVVDSRSLTVRYSRFDTLISDLRDQALTSVLQSPTPYLGKSGLERARAAFDKLRGDEGKVTETFEILTLTGWR